MSNFAAPPMETIRVGFIGVGNRGLTAVKRVSGLPGIEVAALGDVQDVQVEAARQAVRDAGRPGACHAFSGSAESWKGVCDDSGVDVVYIASPAMLHAEMALYALRAGKHVLVEVPGAQTVDEAWEIVETCEKARRHCMMLENCCYGEMEMLAREKGGHGGMDYIMDLRWCHCLHKGLPLDMDVYDLASWSSVVPCSAASDRQGGVPIELPDFTRGAWRTAHPADIGDVDPQSMD